MTMSVLLIVNRPGHGGLRVLAARGDIGGGIESRQFQLDSRKDHKVGLNGLISFCDTGWVAGAGAGATVAGPGAVLGGVVVVGVVCRRRFLPSPPPLLLRVFLLLMFLCRLCDIGMRGVHGTAGHNPSKSPSPVKIASDLAWACRPIETPR